MNRRKIHLWEQKLGARVTWVGIEYGTYDSLRVVRRALVADHWLHARGPVRWRDPRTRTIKAQLRKAFYPDTDAWREAVAEPADDPAGRGRLGADLARDTRHRVRLAT